MPLRQLAKTGRHEHADVHRERHPRCLARDEAGTANRTGAGAIYLRDYNPASGTYAVGRTWYERFITIAASCIVPVGHQLELKLEASNAGQNNMMVAHDRTTYPTFLRLR